MSDKQYFRVWVLTTLIGVVLLIMVIGGTVRDHFNRPFLSWYFGIQALTVTLISIWGCIKARKALNVKE